MPSGGNHKMLKMSETPSSLRRCWGKAQTKQLTKSVPLDDVINDTLRMSPRLWVVHHQPGRGQCVFGKCIQKGRGDCVLLHLGTASSNGPGIRCQPRREHDGTARSQQGRHVSVIAMTLLWQLERVADRTQLTQWPNLTRLSLRPPGILTHCLSPVPTIELRGRRV